jgi:hypothetical protein
MRGFDRIAAVVLALVGFVAGTLLAVEIGHRALGGTGHLLVPYEPVADFVRANAWSSTVVIVIAIMLTVLGLLLLVAELKPRRPGLLVVNSTHPDMTAALPRKSVGRVLESAAGDIPGVDHAAAAVRGRRVVLTAHTALTDAADLQSQVETAAQQALTDLHLRRTPALSVRLQKGSS